MFMFLDIMFIITTANLQDTMISTMSYLVKSQTFGQIKNLTWWTWFILMAIHPMIVHQSHPQSNTPSMVKSLNKSLP